jgi:hypothetical protein
VLLATLPPRPEWRTVLTRLLLFGFAATLPLLPYAFYLKQTTGQWTFTGKTEIMLRKARATAGAPSQERAVTRAWDGAGDPEEPTGLAEEIARHPLRVFGRYAINLHLTDKYVIPGLLSPVLLVGLGFGLLHTRLRRPRELYLAVSAAPCLAIPLILVEPRLFLGVLPPFLIWAGLGIDSAMGKFREGVPTGGGPRRIGAIAIAAVALLFLPEALQPLCATDENAVYRQAGLWMRDHLPGSVRLAFRKPWVAHYAAAESVPIPAGGYRALVDSLHSRRVTHLLIDNRIIRDSYPELLFLAGGRPPSEDLSPLQNFIDDSGACLVLYRIMPR